LCSLILIGSKNQNMDVFCPNKKVLVVKIDLHENEYIYIYIVSLGQPKNINV